MSEFTFQVDGQEIPIQVVRVHLGEDASDAKPFTLIVPAIHLKEVFDSYELCPPDSSLESYLTDLISELGTPIVHCYLESLCSLRGVEGDEFDWIIASIERVYRANSSLAIDGHVVPTTPWPAGWRPEKKL